MFERTQTLVSTSVPTALLLLAPAAAAAQTVTFPVSASFDASSPEVAAFSDVAPGTMHVMGSRVTTPIPAPALAPGGGTPLYTLASLGLSSYPGYQLLDVDAMTNARDQYEAWNVLGSGIRTIDVEFTLARTGGGATGTDALVLAQYDPVNGNGAASDTFLARFTGGARTLFQQATDALGVTPRQASSSTPETNLDALLHGTTPIYPVYYSLSGATASILGVSPADILAVDTPGGTPYRYLEAATLGLQDGDDINALAIRDDVETGAWEVVYSLAAHSPTITGAPPPYTVNTTGPIASAPQPPTLPAATTSMMMSSIGAAGLAFARYEPAGGWNAQPWAQPGDLGLTWAGSVMNPDDVTGVRVNDPLYATTVIVPDIVGQPGEGEGEPGKGGASKSGSGTGGNPSGPSTTQPPGGVPPSPSGGDGFVLAAQVAGLLINETVGGRHKRLALEPSSVFQMKVTSPPDVSGGAVYAVYITPGTIFDTPATLNELGQAVYADPGGASILFATNSDLVEQLHGPSLTVGGKHLPWSYQYPVTTMIAHAPVIVQVVYWYLDKNLQPVEAVSNPIEIENGPWS